MLGVYISRYKIEMLEYHEVAQFEPTESISIIIIIFFPLQSFK